MKDTVSLYLRLASLCNSGEDVKRKEYMQKAENLLQYENTCKKNDADFLRIICEKYIDDIHKEWKDDYPSLYINFIDGIFEYSKWNERKEELKRLHSEYLAYISFVCNWKDFCGTWYGYGDGDGEAGHEFYNILKECDMYVERE